MAKAMKTESYLNPSLWAGKAQRKRKSIENMNIYFLHFMGRDMSEGWSKDNHGQLHYSGPWKMENTAGQW